MEKNTKKEIEVQGTSVSRETLREDVIEKAMKGKPTDLTEEEYKEVEKRKKQKVSKSATVRSLAGVVKNLRETKLITSEEDKVLCEIYKNVTKKWMDTENLI